MTQLAAAWTKLKHKRKAIAASAAFPPSADERVDTQPSPSAASAALALNPAAGRRTAWRWLLFIVLLGALAGLGWLRYAQPVPVAGLRIEPGPQPWIVRGPGLLDATNRVIVTARSQGRLTLVTVQRNDVVGRGQVLAELDMADLRNQLDAARADAEAADQGVEVARSMAAKAQAERERLVRDNDRRSRLSSSGVVSRAEVDTLQSQLRQAEAELAAALTSITRAESQRRSAAATQQAILVRVEEGSIRSPLDGVVISRERNVGDVVLPGAPIMQLVEPASIIVSARFDESTMGVLRAGQRAEVSFVSAQRHQYSGQVLRIGRLVDEETREFTVEVVLDELPEHWALGQRGTVAVQTEVESSRPFVPQHFVRREDGRAGLWFFEAGRARWRPVRLGFTSGPLVEVLEGASHGDVVLEPFGRYEYQPVVPRLP